jgi:ATP-dependent DNA helicase HFM1/MER3
MGIRFPIEGRVKEIGDKVSLLAQSSFANIPFPEKAPSYPLDLVVVMKHLNRIARGMLEVLEQKGDAVSLRNGIEVYQSVRSKAWYFSPACLRQVEGVGAIICKGIFSMIPF